MSSIIPKSRKETREEVVAARAAAVPLADQVGGQEFRPRRPPLDPVRAAGPQGDATIPGSRRLGRSTGEQWSDRTPTPDTVTRPLPVTHCPSGGPTSHGRSA